MRSRAVTIVPIFRIMRDSATSRSRSLRLNVPQLLNLAHCPSRIGPLRIQQWNRLYEGFFSHVSSKSPQISSRFTDLDSFIRATMYLGPLKHEVGATENNILRSLDYEFHAKFVNHVARETGIKYEEIVSLTVSFTRLKQASIEVADRIDQNKPYSDIIESANRDMAHFLKGLPDSVRIA